MRLIRSSHLAPVLPLRPEEHELLPAPKLSTVDEVMTRDVVAVRPDTSLETVAEVLLEHGISGVPVVSATGRLLGLVSKTDLVRRQLVPQDEAEVVAGPGQHLVDGTTVAEVMTREVVSVHVGDSLADAAQVMAFTGVHRVPVLDAKGVMVGLVTTSDVVRWVAGLP